MTRELELQLDRLADLLARRGTTEYFANPLLTPEKKWFPERWTPDLGSVRRTLSRFAQYCGFDDLEIEVGLFANRRDPSFLPEILQGTSHEGGAAALYMGTRENVAYFAVEEEMLGHPDRLKGILAHEMAHAWRHSHGLPVKNARLEERLTDLSTIVLGFGILTANASYSFESHGGLTGGWYSGGFSHRTAGYLSVDTMSSLLAIYAVTREEDLREVRRHLNVTQAAAFQRAAEWAQDMEIGERLGLPAQDERPTLRLESAPELRSSLGHGGTAIRHALERVHEQTGDQGGLASSWLPVLVPPCVERNHQLAHWGRANLRGGWSRRLFLVSDPEWAIELLVLESLDGETLERAAIGFLSDDVCGKRRDLEKALTPLFDPSSPAADKILPEPPAFVLLPTTPALGVSEGERLFNRAVTRFPLERLAGETEWIASFGVQIIERLLQETEPRPGTRKGAPRDALRRWWRLVSDPGQAVAEANVIGTTTADLEELEREAAATREGDGDRVDSDETEPPDSRGLTR